MIKCLKIDFSDVFENILRINDLSILNEWIVYYVNYSHSSTVKNIVVPLGGKAA